MFSDLSKCISAEIPKDKRKKEGIFFTETKTVEYIIQGISEHVSNCCNILEPSCGSCEFVDAIHKFNQKCIIHAVEYNKFIFDKVSDKENEHIKIFNCDFITFDTEIKYDLIIGNPPFFNISKKDVEKKYHSYINGRFNIYILFIVKSLELLNDNGMVCFIIPQNFLSCFYYDRLRKHINNNYQIIDIENLKTTFIDTKQDTILIKIKKTNEKYLNSDYTLNISDMTVLGTETEIKLLKEVLSGSTTLSKLGFKCGVGDFVWNQNKNKLSYEESETRVIYSSSFSNKHKTKPNYASVEGNNTPVIAINRGYGVGKFKLDTDLIDGTYKYVLENHILYIEDKSSKIGLQQLNEMLKHPKTQKFIEVYFKNSSINVRELSYILPLYEI